VSSTSLIASHTARRTITRAPTSLEDARSTSHGPQRQNRRPPHLQQPTATASQPRRRATDAGRRAAQSASPSPRTRRDKPRRSPPVTTATESDPHNSDDAGARSTRTQRESTPTRRRRDAKQRPPEHRQLAQRDPHPPLPSNIAARRLGPLPGAVVGLKRHETIRLSRGTRPSPKNSSPPATAIVFAATLANAGAA